jgi:hypothetical protein
VDQQNHEARQFEIGRRDFLTGAAVAREALDVDA